MSYEARIKGTRLDLGADMPMHGRIAAAHHDARSAAAAIAAEADAEIARLRGHIQSAIDACTMELNPSNYDHDDACQIDRESCETQSILIAALEPKEPSHE